MSVLDEFVRIRLYKKHATEFQRLADTSSSSNVRHRYRLIADHYARMADAEVQSDKARVAERLERLKLERQFATISKALRDARRISELRHLSLRHFLNRRYLVQSRERDDI
ncbi:MAG TPA: hypothetical protein VK653_16490 [Xanthobacteraceae bacterium]|nr:hypothetical protein [Xanthobacteraceae bacterium]